MTRTDPLSPRAALDALLSSRADDATVCPSEVARAIARSRDGADTLWRDEMPFVHAAIDELLDEGVIALGWKGQPLSTRQGPYRIRRDETDETSPKSETRTQS